MPILMVLVVAGIAGVVYMAATRPCLSGHHAHRHWRRRSHRMGNW